MKDNKYVLLIFNDPKDENEFMKEPREIKILKEVSTDTIRGASCGAINMSVFLSDRTKEDIAKMLEDEKIDFLIVEENDAIFKLPKYIRKMFTDEFDSDPSLVDFTDDEPKLNKGNSPKKLTLEEQLAEALENEEFKVAAVLRDKIAKKANGAGNPGPAESGDQGSTMKSLFE